MSLNLLLYTYLLAGFFSVHLHAQVPFNCVVVDSACSSPAKPYGKAIGDLSGDGQPDLFISSANDDGMNWYQYPDWKKYIIRKSGSWSEDCQIADLDIFWANWSGQVDHHADILSCFRQCSTVTALSLP